MDLDQISTIINTGIVSHPSFHTEALYLILNSTSHICYSSIVIQLLSVLSASRANGELHSLFIAALNGRQV